MWVGDTPKVGTHYNFVTIPLNKMFYKLKIEKHDEVKMRNKTQIIIQKREELRKYQNCIKLGEEHTIGLKTDGTVVAVGNYDHGRCDVDTWRDIVAISCGKAHSVGLKIDGTVLAVGDNEYGQCDVEEWQDIIAISCCWYKTAGLRKDGTILLL